MEPIFSGQNISEEKLLEKKVVSTTPKDSNPSTTPIPERPKRNPKRTLRDYSTPSIKEALAGKFKNEEKQLSAKEQFQMYSKADETENFTTEELELKWKEYLARLDDRPNLQATLSRVPELRDNFQLYLEIDNTIQNDLINLTKPELVSFLRKELRNSKVELVIQVTEEIKNRIIYTDTDKFDEMAKKNPILKSLKQKFNLDLGEI